MTIESISWLGTEAPHLNTPVAKTINHVVLGIYGGNEAAGASTNEDGAFAISSVTREYEFAVLLDAHNTSQSAKLILETLKNNLETITTILSLPTKIAFSTMESFLRDTFRSRQFLDQCQTNIIGETSCLFVFRKDRFVWWLSVGDCSIALLHPDYDKWGQYALNQRIYYQWIGQRNSFVSDVPCYSSGVAQLRYGLNTIVMFTDGLLIKRFEDPQTLYKKLYDQETCADLKNAVESILSEIHQDRGRDSATLIAWSIHNLSHGLFPSNSNE